MANLGNFKSNILQLRQNYKKFMVSRVIDNPQNALLELQVPSAVPQKFIVEIQFYSITNNELLQTIVLDSEIDTDVFKASRLLYATDGSSRTMFFIDFSNIELEISTGRYETIFNFFIPKIGTIGENKLIINKISSNREEIELVLSTQYNTLQNRTEITNFASPQIAPERNINNQITNDWVLTTAAYLCNYSQSFDRLLAARERWPLTTPPSAQTNFTVFSSTRIYYGANGQYTSSIFNPGTHDCSNATFTNDPIVGVSKACYTEVSLLPTDRTSPTYNLILEYLPENIKTILSDEKTPISYTTLVSRSIQELLNSTYAFMTHSINQHRTADVNIVFTDKLITNIFTASLDTAFRQYSQKPEVLFV